MATPQEIASLLAAQEAPQTPAMGALMAAREQLATQPSRMPTSYGAPEADAAAMQPETFANPAVARAMGEMASLPQRAIQNSQFALDSGNYDPGPTLEAATLPMGTGAIAGVPVRAGEAVLGAGPIRAYHGSPHDFDAFSMDKIGTGEGAQAYGHGLYFADSPGVAQSYRDALAPGYQRTLDGVPFEKLPSDAHKTVAQWIAGTGAKPEEVAAIANQRALDAQKYAQSGGELESALGQVEAAKHGKIAAAAREIGEAGGGKIGSISNGHMYEVNINADPAHFLDWDKPLSQQHPVVQDAFGKIVDRNIAEEPGWAKLTGEQALRAAVERAGQRGGAETSFREAGIPGIKYLDQGSRGNTRWLARHPQGGVNDFADEQSAKAFVARNPEHTLEPPEQSSNYVVFNDKLIDIARKYGMGSMAALPPAVLAAMGGGSGDQGN